MKQERMKYLSLTLATIIIGLISRRIDSVPLFVGDGLYAVMMFFIIRTIFIRFSISKVAIISLAITYSIEISQLYQAQWINDIRHTLPGRLILGQGFLWSDLIAYLVGVVLITVILKGIE